MRLFVCHASEDKDKVRELVRKLREAGLDPWLDEERLLPGHDWEFEILKAVRESDAVIVCLSPASVDKTGYVQKELRRVLDSAEYRPEGRMFVVPARLEPCAVPSRLQQWQYADLFAEGGFERLLQALKGHAAAPAPLDEPRQTPPRPSPPKPAGLLRRPSIWIVAITLVSLAALLKLYLGALSPVPNTTGNPPARHQDAEPPLGMERIPKGTFLMGRNGHADPEASPAHDVTVESFYLDRTPVTNAQFRRFLSSRNPASHFKTEGADQWPVTGVTWDEAAQFCLAQGKRLPTEAEWEFAARGQDGRLYPWGEDFNAAAVNSRESGIGHREPVGSRPLNRSPYGHRMGVLNGENCFRIATELDRLAREPRSELSRRQLAPPKFAPLFVAVVVAKSCPTQIGADQEKLVYELGVERA